ncbi:MAG: ankyrin repeat domain-containing protein [Campylobacterota bacterium]
MDHLSAEEEQRYIQLQEMALDFAREGEVPTLASMIEAGLPVNTKDHKGNSLLMLACYNGNLECAQMLIAHGADVNENNDHGHSILAGASFKGYLNIVRVLVENKAVIEKHPMKNPVIFASMFGRKEVVDYLQSIDQNPPALKDKLLQNFSRFIALFQSRR